MVDTQNLPGCVRCVVHAVVLVVQLLALPLTLFVAACQAVLIADAFASAVDVPRDQVGELHTRLVWHALAWPVRLAVAAALFPGAFAPLAGAGYGVYWAADESVAAGVAGGVASLLVHALGLHEIHKRSGCFSVVPKSQGLRPKAMLKGCASALADLVSFVCLLFVMGTGFRLPVLAAAVNKRWTSGARHEARGLRLELAVQACLVVLDTLCLPLVVLIYVTGVRAPRLQHRWQQDFAQKRVDKIGKINSWTARMLVLQEALLLLLIDVPTLAVLAVVSGTLYRLPALCHSGGALLAQARPAATESGHSTLYTVLSNGELGLHSLIWTQLILIVLDVLCAPFVLVVFLTGLRIPRLWTQWRAMTGARGELDGFGAAYRELSQATVQMRLLAAQQALLLDLHRDATPTQRAHLRKRLLAMAAAELQLVAARCRRRRTQPAELQLSRRQPRPPRLRQPSMRQLPLLLLRPECSSTQTTRHGMTLRLRRRRRRLRPRVEGQCGGGRSSCSRWRTRSRRRSRRCACTGCPCSRSRASCARCWAGANSSAACTGSTCPVCAPPTTSATCAHCHAGTGPATRTCSACAPPSARRCSTATHITSSG